MFDFFRNKKDRSVEVTISNRTILRIVLLILATLVLVTMARKASHALLLIFIAFFLALALNSPVHWLSQRLPGKSDKRTLATTLSFVFIVLLLLGFLASIVPPLVRQTNTFIKAAPALVSDVRSQDSALGKFVRHYHLQDEVNKFSNELSFKSKDLGGSLLGTTKRVGSNIFSALTVLVLTFMMLIEGPRWLSFADRLIPDDKEKRTHKLAYDMYRVVKGYVNGQLILAALASLFISVPLIILHISYPVALVVIVFICGLIPLVGHTIGAIIVSTVALFHSPWSALIILTYYITYQQIENYALQPKIQANSTNMSPLLVFGAVIVGVNLSGLLGGLLAIPLAGCLRILLLEYLDSRHLLQPKEEAIVAAK
jgi:predicted PurR-regulated permease PerM